EREPLVDVYDEDQNVKVVAEIPGVRKEDIDLTVDEKMLTIKVDTEQRKYYKEVELPVEVSTTGVKATYNNGVLEVTLPKKQTSKPRGEKIKIE
ncbi:MAG: Hsp20/alpha crystallin family protein, partial [Candidatus Caldarchaeum sp.]